MYVSPVIIFFSYACILASSWPHVMRTMSGVGRVATFGCCGESELMPSIDCCSGAMMRVSLCDRYNDKMCVLCGPHKN